MALSFRTRKQFLLSIARWRPSMIPGHSKHFLSPDNNLVLPKHKHNVFFGSLLHQKHIFDKSYRVSSNLQVKDDYLMQIGIHLIPLFCQSKRRFISDLVEMVSRNLSSLIHFEYFHFMFDQEKFFGFLFEPTFNSINRKARNFQTQQFLMKNRHTIYLIIHIHFVSRPWGQISLHSYLFNATAIDILLFSQLRPIQGAEILLSVQF